MPNNVVAQYQNRYLGYKISNDFDTKIRSCKFIAQDGCSHISFDTYKGNGSWYHYIDQLPSEEQQKVGKAMKSRIKKLSDSANYELWHHWLGHPDQKLMEKIHKTAIGVPKLKRNKFCSCASCNSDKFKRKHIGPLKRSGNLQQSEDKTFQPGQHLHADFSFVQGKDWEKQDNDNNLVTSINNC